MRNYLLTIYQPDGGPRPPEVLDGIMRETSAVVDEAKSAGAWVFNGPLHPPSTATVVRLRDGELLTTDGKEHVGGLMIVRAPDLDAALEWGRKAARATTLPIEVRPFQDQAEG